MIAFKIAFLAALGWTLGCYFGKVITGLLSRLVYKLHNVLRK